MPYLKRSDQPDLHYALDDFTDPWREAPYLLLQHGNGRSSRFWYSWVPYLSRFYRIVRPDARGLGRSSADFDLERELTLETCIDDLVAIIDALGVESVHFCGESMGGILGIALAAQHPHRVRTLTLVSTPVYMSDAIKHSYAMGHKSRIDAMKEMGIGAWINATNRSTRFPPDTDPGLLEWYAQEFAKGRPEVLVAMAQLVSRANALSYLPRIRAPVLGLYPSSGRITGGEQEALLLANIKDFRIVRLPTSYHMVHHIAPATCAGHVLHFIAGHDGIPCHES
ncbi:MAG: alpha/beta hydrolase [Betaproteobacteria bacterium]|nr:alpha/beta hydrolase [Betaproteobacteria bacterium]